MSKEQELPKDVVIQPVVSEGVHANVVNTTSRRPGEYTPEDADFHEYSELLRGFFEKITRWSNILDGEEFRESETHSRLQVLQAPDGGLTIAPTYPDKSKKAIEDRERRVLYLTRIEAFTDMPNSGLNPTQFIIQPMRAGRHLLTISDDRKILNGARIAIYDQSQEPMHWRLQSLDIRASRSEESQSGSIDNWGHVGYTLLKVKGRQTFRTTHTGPGAKITDAVAADIINTIDRLIPNPSMGGTPIKQLRPRPH